ncbi:hypothetical protein BH11CYA1_BH11CYA1_33710 [soil metagenome]
MTDKPSMSERPAPNYSMGEQLALRVEQRMQANPNTDLPDFIRNELSDYRNGGNNKAYGEMVSNMTNKLEKDGYLPLLSLQAAREDFDDISKDGKNIKERDLAAQNKMSPAQDAFERFLDGAGRNYLSTKYSELRRVSDDGIKFFGDKEVSRKDINKAIEKSEQLFEKHPKFIDASDFAPAKEAEPKKIEVKASFEFPPIKPVGNRVSEDVASLPASSYKIKFGDTFNEIIASHYSHLYKSERPAAAQVVLQLNPEVKSVNVIQAGTSLSLPTEASMTSHIRHRRRGAHKSH